MRATLWRRGMTAVASALVVAALLAACQSGEASLPQNYQVAGESVLAITVPEETSMVEKDSEEYIYQGVADAGAVAKGYTDQLVSSDNGFTVVDDTFTQTEAPDFSAEEGQVLLAKAGEEEDQLITLEVAWSQDECTVTTSTAQGQITVPQATGSSGASSAMTDDELIDYIKSLPPSALGLEGDTMDSYQVYLMEGNVFVDGSACKRVQVYSRDNPSGTNSFEGLYLVSGDGRSIYRMDPATNETQPLSLP